MQSTQGLNVRRKFAMATLIVALGAVALFAIVMVLRPDSRLSFEDAIIQALSEQPTTFSEFRSRVLALCDTNEAVEYELFVRRAHVDDAPAWARNSERSRRLNEQVMTIRLPTVYLKPGRNVADIRRVQFITWYGGALGGPQANWEIYVGDDDEIVGWVASAIESQERSLRSPAAR